MSRESVPFMPRRKQAGAAKSESFAIVLPATSANLGPAFDAAALAISMFLRVRAKAAKEFSIRARGCDTEICGRMEEHVILTTYREILGRAGHPIVPLALQLDNEIPIGKGCGSSAAARLAGIALANHYGKLNWKDDRIMGEAARREGHVDNVAACWMGGLACGRISDEGEANIARILPTGKWPLLLAVPEESLPTEEARRILPTQYARADAVINIQDSMLLLAAFTQGRSELLPAALEDRMHQPYRAGLCPLLPALCSLSKSEGILGVALSGAGPSVLIFLEPTASFSRIRRRVGAHLAAHGLSATLIHTTITSRGASQSLR